MGAQGICKGSEGTLVLDAGALIALERGDRQVRALVKVGDAAGKVIVPASALAQVWRGGPRSARLALMIKLADVDALDESRAKEIGVRLARSGAKDITDCHVVCCALDRLAIVATSDSSDIEALVTANEPLSLIAV